MRSRTGETRQEREGFSAAEPSDEVGRTPASDCGFADGFHLGRACVEAYRGEGEHGGGFGAENGPRKRSAASGGASASNGATAERSGSGCGRRREATEGNGGAWGSGAASRSGHAGRSRAAAATLPTYDCHVAGAGWRRAGVSAHGEGERKTGRAGRKGGGRPSSACPLFSFFLIPFS